MGLAYVALGGNLGDVRARFEWACARLAACIGRIDGRSRLYRSEPLGPPDQPMYLNAVVRMETPLDPFALLQRMQRIEHKAGRVRTRRWGPRTLDLDLIAYDRKVIRDARLTLPHPRMHERTFVLFPLCDLDPGWIHPVLHRRADAMLAALLRGGEKPLAGLAW